MTSPEEKSFNFDGFHNKIPLHFTAYADFECIIEPKMKQQQTPNFCMNENQSLAALEKVAS